MKKFCKYCYTTSDSMVPPKVNHQVDGIYVTNGLYICSKCLTGWKQKGAAFYCFGCQDIYRASPDWQEPQLKFDQLRVCPCPEHSLSSDEPSVECKLCGKITHPQYAYATSRGNWICKDHMDEAVYCAASYCQERLHPDMDDVVPSGATNLYCEDCARAKTIPDYAPSGYHPLSWDYRPGCRCSACNYLAGRADEWPAVEQPLPDTMCYICGSDCQIEHSIAIKGNYLCHRCEVEETFVCSSCDLRVMRMEFKQAIPMPFNEPHCQNCLEDNPDFWYCDVSCNSFWGKEINCACGGVHKYNYSPEPQFQWAEKQREIPHTEIPFLGFELEVEAHGEDASRPKGASMVRRVADDFSYCVHDGTLKGTSKPGGTGGEHGFEIVTHPFTWDWFNDNWPRIEGLLRMLSNQGYRSWEGGRCGMHIHVSRAPMTDMHQAKFMRFVWGCTNLAMCIGQRDYNDKNLNKFAPFHKEDRSRLIHKIRHNMNPGINNNKHYTAINTNKAPTIEFRWFRGTLNPRSFRKNLEFTHALWYFTKAYGWRSTNEINFIRWLDEDAQRNDYAMLRDYIENEYITRR